MEFFPRHRYQNIGSQLLIRYRKIGRYCILMAHVSVQLSIWNLLLMPVFFLVLAVQPGFASEEGFNLIEISSGIYLHQGKHVALTDAGRDDIANIGFIVGEQCVAVIDTGGSVNTGTELHKKLKSITDKPVCYVINTHIHFDHILGNLAFAGQKTKFIGHVNLPDAIESNRPFFLKEFGQELGLSPSEKSIIAPDTTVTDELIIDLGNRPLKIRAFKVAHTYTDLTVYDPKTRTLWTGDLLFREHIPVLDGSLKGWLDAIEIMKSVEAKTIIPGHGPPGNNMEKVMEAQSKYLNMLLTDTRKAIAEGLFMEEAIDYIGSEAKRDWLLFEEHHRTNVSRAFVELEWE